jgi:hypothetical protein
MHRNGFMKIKLLLYFTANFWLFAHLRYHVFGQGFLSSLRVFAGNAQVVQPRVRPGP